MINKVHDFLFHPFSENHSSQMKALSTITVIALSIFTAGIFLIPFGIINLCDRKVVQQNSTNNKVSLTVKEKVPQIVQESVQNEEPNQIPDDKNIQKEQLNLSPEGLEKIHKIKTKNAEQAALFEQWAENKNWEAFHFAHYDWWAFPISEKSSYGDEYSVNADEIEALKRDEEFMRNYHRCVDLVVKSWGWDLKNDAPILDKERTQEQQWTGYGVRLGKMANSLKLFGEKDLHKKLQKFFDCICLPRAQKDQLDPRVYKNLDRDPIQF